MPHVGDYLVLYVDLLGQASEIESLKAISPDDRAALLAAIEQKAAGIVEIRQWFKDLGRTFHSPEPAGLSDNAEREAFYRARQVPVRQIGVSDSFVHSYALVPIEGAPESSLRAAVGIWYALAGAAGIFLMSAARLGVALAADLPSIWARTYSTTSASVPRSWPHITQNAVKPSTPESLFIDPSTHTSQSLSSRRPTQP